MLRGMNAAGVNETGGCAVLLCVRFLCLQLPLRPVHRSRT